MTTKKLLPHSAKVLVVIGPSGVGKSTIVNALVRNGLLELTPTWTNRPSRPAETELEHHFVTRKTFDRLTASNFFAHEPQEFFGLPYKYAMPFIEEPTPGRIPTLMGRVMAIKLIKSIYPSSIVYQIEAPLSDVRTRLLSRISAGTELGTRLADYDVECEQGRIIADRVFMNDTTIDDVLGSIASALASDFAA